ncbi:MAG: DUF4932 domain-containing protein [Flavobacteriaceae bacterium]
MRISFILLVSLLFLGCHTQKEEFHTQEEHLTIRVNGKVFTKNWRIAPELKPDVFEADCKLPENTVTFSDGKDSLWYHVRLGDTIDFQVILNQKDTAVTRIIGVRPNVNFTLEYIQRNKGKVHVAIPEVSELANILVALHKDAEKDQNMTDSRTEYYKRVRTHFQPYAHHPIMDTVQKYIGGLRYIESLEDSIFSEESYKYYYALKMNACSYQFDQNGQIVNDGIIQQMAKGWNDFDPMKDVALMTDFATKSDFRTFYQQNKPYYDSLLTTYRQLNPIDKMQQWLDEKFGFTYGNYSIYFSPLVYGAHSTKGFKEGDFNQTFMFICPSDYLEEYSNTMNEMVQSRVVFTEIDHNYVNPVSDKYLDQIDTVLSHRDKWAKGEITAMYGTPYKVFNEYMTFGVYSLYLDDMYPEENLLEYLPIMENMMEDTRGFIQFKAFNRELLDTYRKDRTQSMDTLYAHMFKWCDTMNS